MTCLGKGMLLPAWREAKNQPKNHFDWNEIET